MNGIVRCLVAACGQGRMRASSRSSPTRNAPNSWTCAWLESYQTPDWIRSLAAARRGVHEQLTNRASVRVPTADPDCGAPGLTRLARPRPRRNPPAAQARDRAVGVVVEHTAALAGAGTFWPDGWPSGMLSLSEPQLIVGVRESLSGRTRTRRANADAHRPAARRR